MRFILGKARSGKTARIYDEIRECVETGAGRALLLVPEQYSHEAERELALTCGDRMSLYAEVMSFTGFARWNRSLHGGTALKWMDEGGKLLCMAVALRELNPVLHFYGDALENPELQTAMVQELDTIRASASDLLDLRQLALETEGELSRKLSELAVLQETYEAVMKRSGASCEDPLSLLAKQIDRYGLSEFDRVYVDGFLDFTGLELSVLKSLIRTRVNLTVVLPDTRDSMREERYLISKLTRESLKKYSEEQNCSVETVWIESGGSYGKTDLQEDMLAYYGEHMFDYAAQSVSPAGGQIKLMLADTPAIECEAAAAEVLNSVRDDGLRWRDIAIAIRGFSDYRKLLETTFRRYGIPLFVTRRDPLTEKSLPNWIASAYELVLGDWDVDEMISYLHCGFSGLSEETCDALCSYVFRWQLKAPAWLRNAPWQQHPDGYGKPRTEDSEARLKELNAAREKIAGPLILLKERISAAGDAAAQAEALRDFLAAADIPKLLQQKINRFELDGELELRAETLQLWEMIGNAISQMSIVLGHMPMDGPTFYRLFKTVLSRYDIGLIPVSLDRVSAGDFDRMRRRNIRRLIVLGCNDGRLPPPRSVGGLFTPAERDILAEHGLNVGGGEAELWREYALMYHTLALPREKLILSYPEVGFNGDPQSPALVFTMAARIFSIQPDRVFPARLRLNAAEPALGLALTAGSAQSCAEARAAEKWYLSFQPEKLSFLRQAVHTDRALLSPEAVKALYGKSLKISPSRLDAFSDCHYSYFCRYGMKAEATEPAGFKPPEIGTFTHAVLEKTVKKVKELGGFRAVPDLQLREIAESYIQDYIHTELNDYSEKSARFRSLFERLCSDLINVVIDTADELRNSDYEPLSFELDMSGLKTRLNCGDAGFVRLTGIADRIDGFHDGDGLKLRIVDYKTGNKQFHLYDVLYGRNLQMLVYLFAVCDNSEELYGETAKPSGIIYVPARNGLLHFDEEPDDAGEAEQRKKEKQRSGLVLSEAAVLQAWEHGSDQRFIPQKTRARNPFVSAEQMKLLRHQAEYCLREMAEQVSAGVIDANPIWQTDTDNACRNCPYSPVCRFEEGLNGEKSRIVRKITDEEVWQLLEEGDRAEG